MDFVVVDQVSVTHEIPGLLWTTPSRRTERFWPRVAGTPLESAEIKALERYAHSVEENYLPIIDNAVRRCISAVRERVDIQDAIVDAVISWESLFGHVDVNSEVTFRVTCAIARLLRIDPDEREDLRSRLAKVYRVRSKIVHGEELRPKDKAPEMKELAIKTGVEAFQRLFRDRPELIANRNRAMILLLEAS